MRQGWTRARFQFSLRYWQLVHCSVGIISDFGAFVGGDRDEALRQLVAGWNDERASMTPIFVEVGCKRDHGKKRRHHHHHHHHHHGHRQRKRL